MKNFKVYNKNELISEVSFKDNKAYIKRYSLNPVHQWFYSNEMSLFEVLQILEGRCWDKNRTDLPQLLKNIGVSTFNSYEICRKTHGLKRDDYSWIKFDGEDITYDDIKIRE